VMILATTRKVTKKAVSTDNIMGGKYPGAASF